MTLSVGLVLGIYGAVVSTVVAVLHVLRFFRDRPRVSVEAGTVMAAATEGQDAHGVLVQVRRGHDILWEEVDVEIRIRNHGGKACQINDVFIEGTTTIQCVHPEPLPIVLDPGTSCAVRVQPEYFAPRGIDDDGNLKDELVLTIGVSDGLGNRHNLPWGQLTTLVNSCRDLPLRTNVFRHKETGNLVSAFQCKDAATLVRKKVRAT